MKITYALLLAFAVLLSGCATAGITTKKNPYVDRYIKKKVGYIALWGYEAEPNRYRIVAQGTVYIPQKDLLVAWDQFAREIAGNRAYTQSYVAEEYPYSNPYDFPTQPYYAQKLTGDLVITQHIY